MQYDQGQDASPKGTSNDTNIATQQSMPVTQNNHRWVYDSRDTIEVGSLIVSHPSQDSACGGLKQQHFHKCIILVMDHSPQEGTKGIILNRPTNQKLKDERKNEWKCFFGGNTQGIGSEDESLGCIYRINGLSSQVTLGMAIKILDDTIMDDIAIMPWDIAKCLVQEKEANQDDIRLYRGYTKWGPGQLESEIRNGDWFTVAADRESLWDMIVQDSSFATGTDKWVQIMKKVGKESLISAAPNQKFQDDMLKQYMRLRLLKKTTQNPSYREDHKRKFGDFAPGTLVRSSAPILLDEQVFHQSLVLILQNDAKLTAGVVLNRPYSTSVSIGDSSLPVRYGGRFELDEEGMPELWLHCNHQMLQEAKIGEPISDNEQSHSIFWKCSRKDAEAAVDVGLAKAEDFLVVSGLSIWRKGDASNDDEDPSFLHLDDSFSKVDRHCIDTIWKLLMIQEPLNTKNAAENLEAANAAWMLSGEAGWMLSGGTKQFDSRSSSDMDTQEQQVVQSLAYSALDMWIRMYLLKP